MVYLYSKEYLKQLNIQRSYLKKFMWNVASFPLRLELAKAVKAIDDEIEECKNSILLYKLKKDSEKVCNITIFEL